MNDPLQSPERYEQFLALFAQNHERLFGYIFSLIPRHQDAEDLFQKTSLVLWRKFEQVRPDGDFFAWACKVAYLEVRNYRRTSARDRHFFSEELTATLAEQRAATIGANSHRMTALQECMKRISQSHAILSERPTRVTSRLARWLTSWAGPFRPFTTVPYREQNISSTLHLDATTVYPQAG